MNLQDKKKDIPEEFKQLAQDFSDNGFITTSLDNLVNWARTGSLHWMMLESLLFSIKTISPFSTSLTNFAPIMSNAQVSDAKT